jgi:ElaB/YqjD/DUF883 family membrane-anchored ribosome-binding protein
MRNGTALLQKQIDTLRDDFVDILNSASKLVAGKAIDAKDVVVDRSGDAFSAFVKLIKNRPVAAVGVAFGLGYLAMRMFRR